MISTPRATHPTSPVLDPEMFEISNLPIQNKEVQKAINDLNPGKFLEED